MWNKHQAQLWLSMIDSHLEKFLPQLNELRKEMSKNYVKKSGSSDFSCWQASKEEFLFICLRKTQCQHNFSGMRPAEYLIISPPDSEEILDRIPLVS